MLDADTWLFKLFDSNSSAEIKNLQQAATWKVYNPDKYNLYEKQATIKSYQNKLGQGDPKGYE